MAKNILIIILILIVAGVGYTAWDSHQKAAAIEDNTSSLEQAIATANAEKENLQQNLEEARNQLNEARETLEARINSLQGDIASRDDLIDSLMDELEPLQERLETYRGRIAETLSEKEGLQEQVESLNDLLDARNIEVADLRSELRTVRESFSETRQNLTRLRQETSEPEPEVEVDEDEVVDEEIREAMPLIPEASSAGIFTSRKRVEVRNTTGTALTVSVSYTRAGDGSFDTTEVRVPANGSVRLEGDGNRNFRPGDRITLDHPDYLPLEFTVP